MEEELTPPRAKKKKYLSRSEIFNGHRRLRIQDVELQDGGFVQIQQWTGADQQSVIDIENSIDKKAQAVRFLCHVIARSLVDGTGERLSDGNEGDVQAIEEKWLNADILAVSQACLELNGLTADAQAIIEKN